LAELAYSKQGANVISADLFALGQLVPGDQVQFVKVCKNQAHTLLVSQKHYIKQYTS
jgi:allophanate hydrolase subunit 2